MEESWKNFQTGLRVAEKKRRRRWLAVLVFALLVAAGLVAAQVAPWFDASPPGPDRVWKPPAPAESCRDVLRKITWPTPTQSSEGRYEEWVDGNRIVYTLDPELQEQAQAVFRRYDVPYGAFVALEPATGRVLALTEYSREEPDLTNFCGRATYPAASLVKIVTAAAALGTGEVRPATEIRYEGNPYRLYRRKISPRNRRRENNVSTLAEALGRSNNVVFAKLGADVVGAKTLDATLSAFGFNRSIPFDFRLQESRATVPKDRYLLAETAAGFGDIYLSPVHAALIGAAVGNRGLMMKPYVVESVENAKGDVIYRAAPAPLGRCMTEEVARELAQMMERTVTAGTSARVFSRYARKLKNTVGVAGKTGSLTGQNPPGMYEWFIGFAPVEDPKIAVASLVVNKELWHIKGTYVAQAVMKEFFGL